MALTVKYKDLNSAVNAARMFEIRKQVSLSVLSGNFSQARTEQKEFAKIAVDNFDTLKTLPKITITNIPLKDWLVFAFRSLEFRVYRTFSKKTPEEKLFAKQYKSYIQALKQKKLNVTA